MSTLHNAAILLMSLPEEDAGALLEKLTPPEVEQVTVEIARMKQVSGEEQDQVIKDFANANPAAGGDGGGIDLAKSLVKKALGANASDILDSLRLQIEAVPFSFLRNVDSQNVITYLVDEHPQTIALIISHLPSNYGAEVMAGLPADRQLAVIRRMATMGQTNPDIIREVEQGLERRMSSVMTQSFENAGGVDSVAQILNVSDRATERMILDAIGEDDPELVEEIRRLMFVFEDIAKFEPKSVQTLLKHVENSQWALALKGASSELQEKVFGNLSSRASETLREEIEFLGAVKLSVVEEMQQQVVDTVRRLEDTGELELNVGGEEEELVQ